MRSTPTRKRMKVGDFVKWYELYHDVYIVRDAGYGIIIGKTVYDYWDPPVITFEVFRSKYHDKMFFEAHQLEAFDDEGG